MAEKLTLERADPNAYRIKDAGGLRALALKLANGQWGAYAVDGGKALTKRRFDKPKDVRDWVAGEI